MKAYGTITIECDCGVKHTKELHEVSVQRVGCLCGHFDTCSCPRAPFVFVACECGQRKWVRL